MSPLSKFFDQGKHPRGRAGRFSSKTDAAADFLTLHAQGAKRQLQDQRQADAKENIQTAAQRQRDATSPTFEARWTQAKGGQAWGVGRSAIPSGATPPASWQTLGAKTPEIPVSYTGSRKKDNGGFVEHKFTSQVPKGITPEAHMANVKVFTETAKGMKKDIFDKAQERGFIPEGTDKTVLNRAYGHMAAIVMHKIGLAHYDWKMDDSLKAQMKPLIPAMRYFERRLFNDTMNHKKIDREPYRKEFGVPFKDNRKTKGTNDIRLRFQPRHEFVKTVPAQEMQKLWSDLASQSFQAAQKYGPKVAGAIGGFFRQTAPAVANLGRAAAARVGNTAVGRFAAKHADGFIAGPEQYVGTKVGGAAGRLIGGDRGAKIGAKVGRVTGFATEYGPAAFTAYSIGNAVHRSPQGPQQMATTATNGNGNNQSWKQDRLQIAHNEAQGQVSQKPLTIAQRQERLRAAKTKAMDTRQGTPLTQPGQSGSIANQHLKRDPTLGSENKQQKLGKAYDESKHKRDEEGRFSGETLNNQLGAGVGFGAGGATGILAGTQYARRYFRGRHTLAASSIIGVGGALAGGLAGMWAGAAFPKSKENENRRRVVVHGSLISSAAATFGIHELLRRRSLRRAVDDFIAKHPVRPRAVAGLLKRHPTVHPLTRALVPSDYASFIHQQPEGTQHAPPHVQAVMPDAMKILNGGHATVQRKMAGVSTMRRRNTIAHTQPLSLSLHKQAFINDGYAAFA